MTKEEIIEHLARSQDDFIDDLERQEVDFEDLGEVWADINTSLMIDPSQENISKLAIALSRKFIGDFRDNYLRKTHSLLSELAKLTLEDFIEVMNAQEQNHVKNSARLRDYFEKIYIQIPREGY